MSSPGHTDRTRSKRLPELASHDLADLHAILDAALVAHICVVDGDQPFVVPVAFARSADTVYIHGSTKSRLFTQLAKGASTCLTVTLLDGLVVARSVFESSMNYRSVISDHLLPGRWDEARHPNEQEDKATMVLALDLNECSVKISAGAPDDAPADVELPIWAGVVPLTEYFGEPIDAPDLPIDIAVPDYIRQWKR